MWRPSMMVAILVFLIVGARAKKALNGLCIQILIAFGSWHILLRLLQNGYETT